MAINALRHQHAASTEDLRLQAVAKDVQLLMQTLRSRAREISQTMSWEYVAMGVAEINEIARCTSDLMQTLIATEELNRPVPLCRSIKQMQTLLRTVAGNRLSLSYDFPDGDAGVSLPVQALEQMLINLVHNAKSADASEAEIAIRLSLNDQDAENSDLSDGYATLTVRDNGKGLDFDIFEMPQVRYFSASSPDWFGVGLNSVNTLVAGVGGCLGVASESGKGMIAELRFPICKADTKSHYNGANDNLEQAQSSAA